MTTATALRPSHADRLPLLQRRNAVRDARQGVRKEAASDLPWILSLTTIFAILVAGIIVAGIHVAAAVPLTRSAPAVVVVEPVQTTSSRAASDRAIAAITLAVFRTLSKGDAGR